VASSHWMIPIRLIPSILSRAMLVQRTGKDGGGGLTGGGDFLARASRWSLTATSRVVFGEEKARTGLREFTARSMEGLASSAACCREDGRQLEAVRHW
jgi:hypothetical protein